MTEESSKEEVISYTLTITYQGESYCERVVNTNQEHMDYLIDLISEGGADFVMRNGWLVGQYNIKPKRIVFPKNVLRNSIVFYS